MNSSSIFHRSLINLLLSVLFLLCTLTSCLGQFVPFSTSYTVLDDNDGIETIFLRGEIGNTDSRNINSSVEYVYQFTVISPFPISNDSSIDQSIRVHVGTDSMDTTLPVLFVVRQQTEVMAWPLPIKSTVEGKVYQEASRTLCGDVVGSKSIFNQRTFFVSVSTSSPVNVSFQITVSTEQPFLIQLGQKETVDVLPLAPRFYKFSFPKTRYVLLQVTSEDDICMTVSIQNNTCPILDQENNVQYQGYWQTMTRKAGMTLRHEDFPQGFYIIFVPHGDDTRCKTTDDGWKKLEIKDSPVSKNDRIKKISFVINAKITNTEYLAAIVGVVGFFLLFYIFSIIVSCVYCCQRTIPELPLQVEAESDTPTFGHFPPLHTAAPSAGPSTQQNDREIREIYSQECGGQRQRRCAKKVHATREQVSISNEERDDMHHRLIVESDANSEDTDDEMLDISSLGRHTDNNVMGTTAHLCVAALAQKDPQILSKRSKQYLWGLLTVAIFYSLPVVQLVFNYQKVLHTTGNQDLCYYNYLCANPLWILSDFNHVNSNIGYIMLGALFLLLVLRREKIHKNLACTHPRMEMKYGIPMHFGLFYAMGLAMILEGVLSACYHVCPNHSNFQFDTCFMYVNAMLLMLKLYQTRHPDINASAHVAFTTLAVVVMLGVVGVVWDTLYFSIIFTFLHVTFCLYLSIRIYYLDQVSFDSGILRRVYTFLRDEFIAEPSRSLKPLYTYRMSFLVIANLGNWIIAGIGMEKLSHEFASHLLYIFVMNLALYFSFYIIMKILQGEQLTFQPLIYISLSILFWVPSMYFFIFHSDTSWQLTPAESRTFNTECILLDFYDGHDIWHFLSAASIFFSFMTLLTLDDELIYTLRTKIAVF